MRLLWTEPRQDTVVEDGEIVRHLVFCPGAWTAEDLELQRREAPMVECDDLAAPVAR